MGSVSREGTVCLKPSSDTKMIQTIFFNNLVRQSWVPGFNRKKLIQPQMKMYATIRADMGTLSHENKEGGGKKHKQSIWESQTGELNSHQMKWFSDSHSQCLALGEKPSCGLPHMTATLRRVSLQWEQEVRVKTGKSVLAAGGSRPQKWLTELFWLGRNFLRRFPFFNIIFGRLHNSSRSFQ